MDVFDLFAKIGLDTSSYEQGLKESKGQLSSFGGAIGGVAKTAVAGFATITTSAIAVGGEMAKLAGETAAYGDNIDKASQKLGVSAEFYQEWDAVLQHSGTSMSAMTGTFKTLAKATQNASKEQAAAFEELGISLDDVSAMSAEEAFTTVVSKLQEMPESTERAMIAQQLLGKGAMEMGALLNTSAEDTQAMIDTVNQLGGVMSDEAVKSAAAYQDSLQDLTTSMDGIKRSVVGSFLPSMVDLMNGLTGLFSGSEDGLKLFSDGVNNMISALISSIPMVVDTATKIVEALWQGIFDNLPKVVDAAFEIVTKLADSITSALPELLPAVVEMILIICEHLVSPENLGNLIKSALDMVVALAEGLINSLPVLAKEVPKIVETVVTTINGALPELITSAIEIMNALVTGIIGALPMILSADTEIISTMITGLIDAIPDILLAIPQIVKAIADALLNVNWGEVGGNIIKGIGNGLVAGAKNIGGMISDAGDQLVDGFKDIFGIHSPSTLFRDQVGKFLAMGIGEGFTDEMGNVADDMAKAVPTDFDVNTNVSGRTAVSGIVGGGITVNLSIDKFTAYGDDDIDSLAARISRAIYSQTARKGAAY